MLLVNMAEFDYLGRSSADDEIDFWSIPVPASAFFPSEESKAELLDDLFSDYLNIGNQREKFCQIMPHKVEFANRQYSEALDKIEKQVKKLLGNRVTYKTTKGS